MAENKDLEQRILRIERMLEALLEAVGSSYDEEMVQFSGSGNPIDPEGAPIKPLPQEEVVSVTPDPNKDYRDTAAKYNAIWSPEIQAIVDKYERETGENAPSFFMKDLDGFDGDEHYRTVIEKEPGLTDFQKATYFFTMRGAAMMNAFLGTRREYYASEVVPVNDPKGSGRVEYGYRATNSKLPEVILVPSVKTEEDALSWIKAWVTGSMDAWRQARKKAGMS